MKYFKHQLGKEKIQVITCKKRNEKISYTLKQRLITDTDLKMKYIKQLQSKSSWPFFRSKGELRLKNWLRNNCPEYDWKTKHLVYENGVYEFDIHSKKLDDFYIEYNGACHYKKIHSEENFQFVQARYKLKQEIMKKLGKKFIVIRDKMKFAEQIEYLLNEFKLNGDEGTHDLQFSL